MSTKIGRFEILGELAKSDWSAVYKASDPESGQTLALKVLRMDVFGEHAEEVTQRILQEAETTKELDSPNITLVFGAGEIDGQFCAAMEYIQGNSIATMLARKEGFSIWDLLDISRQVCQALDHVHQHNVFHYSLEPAKVMVTWDGTVKILSFGISSTGYMAAVGSGAPPNVLHYMSPEQVSGDPVDARSNLFTWGAILYEMVTDLKAFGGDDADAVRQKILQEMPVAPALVNPRINPMASEVIMKALAKNPAERYQSGREMAADMERCREASTKVTKKAAEPAKGPAVPTSVRAAASTKFASAPTAAPPAPKASRPQPPAPQTFKVEPAPSVSEELETSWTPPAQPVEKKPAEPSRAAAAAAGWNSPAAMTSGRTPQLDASSQFISSVVRASVGAMEAPNANLSAAVADELAVEQPKIAVDPMMAENSGGSNGPSFSELDELPPLKEVYVAPPVPHSEEPELAEALPATVLRRTEPEKPKIQPREVAEKAIQEIKSIPPKLMMYSILAAVGLIVLVCGLVYWHSQSQNTDEEGSVPARASAPARPAPVQPPAPVKPVVTQPPAAHAEAPEEASPAEPVRSVPAKTAKARNAKNKKAPAPAPIPGQLAVDSTPGGAQVQIDGKSDPNWLTPYTMPGLAAGEHTVVVSKPGYVQEIRTVAVTSAAKVSLVVHLTAQVVSMNVSSDPAGAVIYVDGKDTAKVTPAVISFEKGNHIVLVRKPGFLDETTAANGQPGQTLHFATRLRPLGNVDDIKTVGKFKKIFGGGGAQAGMSKVSIKTSPKGAQIAINRRILEKTSPVEILLNPGNYIVDITLSGYQPVQKVITIDQGGTTVIDETLQTQ